MLSFGGFVAMPAWAMEVDVCIVTKTSPVVEPPRESVIVTMNLMVPEKTQGWGEKTMDSGRRVSVPEGVEGQLTEVTLKASPSGSFAAAMSLASEMVTFNPAFPLTG
jgi:hypothetical protein